MKKILLLLVFCMSGCSKSDSAQAGEDLSALANFVLVELRTDIDLIRELEKTEVFNGHVRKTLISSFVGKLFVLVKIRPNAEELKGEALESFCSIYKFSYGQYVLETHDQAMLSMMEPYIEQAGRQSEQRVKEIQKSLKGTGCSLSP